MRFMSSVFFLRNSGVDRPRACAFDGAERLESPNGRTVRDLKGFATNGRMRAPTGLTGV
jgi:hypothetical protein